jgi:hypothetical protein
MVLMAVRAVTAVKAVTAVTVFKCVLVCICRVDWYYSIL